MPTITISATRQTADPRSDELQCNVTIRNDGKDAIRLLSLRPRNPEGTVVQQILDSSLERYRLEKEEITLELSTLLSQFIFVNSVEYRARFIDRQREALKDLTSGLGILGMYLKFVTGRMLLTQRRLREQANAWRLTISWARQAHQYYDEFLKGSEDKDELLIGVFRSKLYQLEVLETLLGGEEKEHLTDLESGVSFSRTYVFNCKRSLFNPKTYTITFDCTFISDDVVEYNKAALQLVSTDISTTISPKPVVLNIFALLSSLLGMILNLALISVQSKQSDSFFHL
jgi:hypothetical protein